ncbi:O-methyltransferase [Thiohalophilus sp.]|uniref:O-methyltransferase n=1 Tax=Thiohalophilus sp. TaxID=3028392 RepID=UPI002ACE8D41|nr:class I SAM-dependent methyltransferase [Thiohalophilus sp.]MDZ7661032.1 class I SAM-dependent methyltransferase [Thiohalophilus sp.]
MRLSSNRQRELWSLLILVVVAVLAIATNSLLLPVLVALFVLLVMLNAQVKYFRQMKETLGKVRSESQAVPAMYTFLQPNRLLPEFGPFTLSARKTTGLMELVLDEKPGMIVELGSGVSTLISAYCLKKNGKGKLISFEHEAQFAEYTEENIRNHGLSGYVEVIHAPLVDVEIDGHVYQWYQIDPGKIKDNIDLLFIDGPVGREQKNARYPALPVLRDKLNPGAVILLDDANRKDEKAIRKMWLQENPGMKEYKGFFREDMFAARMAGK